MQSDGNLVIYNTVKGAATWATNTDDSGATAPYSAVFQKDFNFVTYNKANQPTWSSSTQDNASTALTMQNDGNLVLYNGSSPVWATSTVDTPPAASSAAPSCSTTPLIAGGCVNACTAKYGTWANGDNKVNLNSPGQGGICSCTTPQGCTLPPGFTQ